VPGLLRSGESAQNALTGISTVCIPSGVRLR